MRLDREHLTVASVVMLPTYVVFFTGIGIAQVATPKARLLASPMLRYSDRLMDLRAWGALFIACGLLMLTALWLRNRMLYRYGLVVCGLSMAAWALVALVGIWYEPVSYSAWLWPAFATAACWASNRSLERGEQDRRTGR